MRKAQFLPLLAFWSVVFATNFASFAAIPRRMGTDQVYQVVEKYRLKAEGGKSENARRNMIRTLHDILKQELHRNKNTDDPAYALAYRVFGHTRIILQNSCGKAHEILTSGSGPRSRETREGLYLYQSVCRS